MPRFHTILVEIPDHCTDEQAGEQLAAAIASVFLPDGSGLTAARVVEHHLENVLGSGDDDVVRDDTPQRKAWVDNLRAHAGALLELVRFDLSCVVGTVTNVTDDGTVTIELANGETRTLSTDDLIDLEVVSDEGVAR